MSDELRRREDAPDRSTPRTVNTENQLTHHDESNAVSTAAPASPARRHGAAAAGPLERRCGCAADLDDRADDLYDEGAMPIEEGKYDRAVDRFNRLIELKSNRTDAALYWKAYSLLRSSDSAPRR